MEPPSETTRSGSVSGMVSVMGSVSATATESGEDDRAWSVGSNVAYVGTERSNGSHETESEMRVALVDGQ